VTSRDGDVSAWDFAVSCYERPGVKALCLALQDAHGQSVILLLWGLWTARPGAPDQRGAAPDLAGAVRLARDWEDQILTPLRAVRGRLDAPPWSPGGAPAPRRQILAAELAAERALLEALEALAPAAADPGAERPGLEGGAARLIALSAMWGPPIPAALLEALAAAAAAT
jgi:uncharacterized protein (TIGR02444 family)